MLAVFSCLMILAGYSIVGREGVLWSIVISLSIIAFIYFYVESYVLNGFSGELIEGQDSWGVMSDLKELAHKARIGLPKLIIIQNSSPQVFLLSKNWNHSHILITSGFLHRLNQSDKKAILAYCVASIKRQDTFGHLVATVLTSFLLKVAQLFDHFYRWLLGIKSTETYAHNYPITYLSAPIAKIILTSIIRKNDYLNADALASSYLENPNDLANALWKLQSYSQTLPMIIPAYLAHGFIVNPLTPKGWTRYFLVQPAVKERIKNLVGYYPL